VGAGFPHRRVASDNPGSTPESASDWFRARPKDLKRHEEIQTGLICQVKLFRPRESARRSNAGRVLTVEAEAQRT